MDAIQSLAAQRRPSDKLPLVGRTVAVVHAAWHSCGSYRINVTQVEAYRALGAHVLSYAIREWPPGPLAPEGDFWTQYIAKTPDMPADERFYANMTFDAWRSLEFWTEVYWPLIHGDHARATCAMMALAPIAEGLIGRTIDLVHCNHFFCLPAARKLGSMPILCETQDIQARQYDLRNDKAFVVPPRATYAAMLNHELKVLSSARALVHLNEAEYMEFQRIAPQMRHELVYPAVDPVATGPGGETCLIVASANEPNILSVIWFLESIVPKLPKNLVSKIKIAGNVDAAVSDRAPQTFARWNALFLGRVEDIGALYADAGLVLLPTVEGHGLSIKAVEAFSSGAPLIATPQAFRGMKADPSQMGNVTLCSDAESFAAALQRRLSQPLMNDYSAQPSARANSDTRKIWEQDFSPRAYTQKIADLAASVL